MKFTWATLALVFYLAIKLTWGQTVNLPRRHSEDPAEVAQRDFLPHSVQETINKAADISSERKSRRTIRALDFLFNKGLDFVTNVTKKAVTPVVELPRFLINKLTGSKVSKPDNSILQFPQMPDIKIPGNLSPRSVQEAFSKAKDIIRERKIRFPGRTCDCENRPEARHQNFLSASSRSLILDKLQEIFEEVTRLLLKTFILTPLQIMFGLAKLDLKSMLKGNDVQKCEAQFSITSCRKSARFRTLDGTCNNLREPSWGMASSCYQRLVNPDYSDGIAAKRVAKSGKDLPSPRQVSLQIHDHVDNPTKNLNHMFTVWGQFLDHDIALTPLSRGPDNQNLECCPINDIDPENCDPILIDKDDPFFRNFNIDCLTNVRSTMCSTCTLGPRQQTNQVTAYIDASHIYGLNQNTSRGLRNNDGTGTMRFVIVDEAGELPPGSFIPNEDQCSSQNPTFDCFETGDQRANQHPALTSLHIIFLREHNRLARKLKEINPNWNDERLFQEARRIVGAEMQMVTYNEYLPLTLGPEIMELLGLAIRPDDQFTQYDETVQGALFNEFSTAAFRFGHSMINSFFLENQDRNDGYRLKDIFNFPFGIYRGQLDGVVEGLTKSPSQNCDRNIIQDVTNHLYEIRGRGSGMDLAALNINRGRDHGIPGYTTLVEFCGGPKITAWKQLKKRFQAKVRPLFQRVYEKVEDIDLFSGGVAETSYKDTVVGPTFACIIGMQFNHLKYGDRFYFEHGGQVGSFTPAQLQEIKKVTLGKLLCQNSKIDETPENAFLHPGNQNPLQWCDEKPDMDINAWRE